MKVYEYRIRRVPRSIAHEGPTEISSPGHLVGLFRHISRNEPREIFMVAMLNIKNRLLGYEIVAIGHTAGVSVHPREVFRAAILANASSIVIAHNHPSGDAIPSNDDRALTCRIVQAGDLIGIPVLDHVIVTDDNYYSVSENEPTALS